MNPNYFNRNNMNNIAESVQQIINEKKTAVTQHAIEANAARRELRAMTRARAQEIANQRRQQEFETRQAAESDPNFVGPPSSASGLPQHTDVNATQKPGWEAQDIKTARAELGTSQEYQDLLYAAGRLRNHGGARFGGPSQRTEGDVPMSGMAERGAAAQAAQAERETEIRREKIKQGYERDGKPMPGTEETRQEQIDRIKGEVAAERKNVEAEERAKLDAEQSARDADIADAASAARAAGDTRYRTPEERMAPSAYGKSERSKLVSRPQDKPTGTIRDLIGTNRLFGSRPIN